MQTKDTSLISDARELALNLVQNIMENGAYANISLENTLRSSSLAHNDKNLVTEIVNVSIRMTKHLDWVLSLFLKKSIDKQNPWLRNILRISAYQLLFMERIPGYAVVNSAVELAHKKTSKTLAGVCNAVLRNLIRNKDKITYPPANTPEYFAVYYSQPEWLANLWLNEYGAEVTENIFQYLNCKPPLTLRANTLQTTSELLCKDLSQEGVIATVSPIACESVRVESMDKSIEELEAYQTGKFYVQNEAAMLAGDILAPQTGEEVLDLCSGIGGKTTHFAEKMKNHGLVKAVELHQHKLLLLKNNCQRLGINIVEAELNNILAMNDDRPIWQRVFLDVPCSGLGVLNRRADARWRKDPQEIRELTNLQRDLLNQAGKMTAPGGILVYSTCTINPAENEDIVNRFLNENHAFELDPFGALITNFPLDINDRARADKGCLPILPGKYGTDGMFYTRFRRSKTD
jgi:16S rRNA (cytosine967-C5)-methyltransferase